MTRTIGPDCAVMCNLIKYTHISRVWSEVFIVSITDPPLGGSMRVHRMTRTTGPDCAVMCNFINTHTHTQQGGGINASGIE